MRKLWFIVLFLVVTVLAGYTLPALAGLEGGGGWDAGKGVGDR